MVLHRLADAGQMVHHRNAEIGQMLLRPDAGQQQKLRRVDRAAAQDHLAPRAGGDREAVLAERDTDRAVASKMMRSASAPVTTRRLRRCVAGFR